jgi:signal transduction histidine kinase
VRTGCEFRGWGAFIVAACGVLALLAQGRPAAAQEFPQRRVLVLYASLPGGAASTDFDVAYQRVLGTALGNGLDLHSEYIDLARFSGPDYPDALAAFLRYKYERLPPDVVVAPTEGALRFARRFRAMLFPGTPIVFITRVPSPEPGPAMFGINAPLDLPGTLDLALTLQPATRRVFVVSGVSEFDKLYEGLARAQFARLAKRLTFTYLTGLPIADLERAVAHLPPESILYFLTLGEDGAGARLRSTDVLRRLTALANVPTYAWNTVGMDCGIVGGVLYSNEIVAEHSARLTLRILRGEADAGMQADAVNPNVTQLDWRQLRRWGISEALAPAGTAILFRERSLWDRYQGYIAGALTLVLFQAALIAGLLVQRARGRRMASAMRENQARLEASNRQISDLFGRLITAQETERGRIARDLHDDVSQRIAGLSIMISGLKSRLGGTAKGADVSATLAAIQRNTIGLAEEIRHLSHDLHPSMLQHAGLVAALQGACADFEKLHGITVTYNPDAAIGAVDGDTAVCLYRIAQEALRNVAKHAHATHVDVALTRSVAGLQLTIADDGHGFDLAGTRARAGGLGLVSIDERVRLLQGTVAIETQPRRGTRLRVLIPPPPALQ